MRNQIFSKQVPQKIDQLQKVDTSPINSLTKLSPRSGGQVAAVKWRRSSGGGQVAAAKRRRSSGGGQAAAVKRRRPSGGGQAVAAKRRWLNV